MNSIRSIRTFKKVYSTLYRIGSDLYKMANHAFVFFTSQSSKKVQIPFCDLAPGICPQVSPVIVGDQNEFIQALRRNGVAATYWPDLPEKVEDNERYPIANFLFKHLVVLPIHENIDEALLRHKIASLRNKL